jgi:RIP metalloprotease RseP
METIQGLTSSGLGIAAAILVFGVCIFFHEAGHFLAAKASGMRVDAFALGFGPRLLGWRRGETEYSIRIFPVGGFVAIAGMEPGETAVERGFHSKSRWLGAATIFAGVLMNVVLAVLLFTIVIYTQGVTVPGAQGATIHGIYPNTPAARSDLRTGDLIVAVDGNRKGLGIEKVAPGSIADRLGIEAGGRLIQVGDKGVGAPTGLLEYLRAGAEGPQRVVYADATSTDISKAFHNLMLPPLPKLKQVSGASPAEAQAALRQALGVEFAPLSQFDLVLYTGLHPNQRLTLTVARKGEELEIPVTTYALQDQEVRVDAQGRIATPFVTVGRIGLRLQLPTEPVPLWKAAALGAEGSVGAVVQVALSLKALVSGKIVGGAGGPVKIFSETYEAAQLGWAEVASFAALLSANLAVINFLPFPPLDGFVLVQLVYEAMRKRRVNARIEYLIKVAGVLVILGLFVMLTFNDLRNLVLHGKP